MRQSKAAHIGLKYRKSANTWFLKPIQKSVNKHFSEIPSRLWNSSFQQQPSGFFRSTSVLKSRWLQLKMVFQISFNIIKERKILKKGIWLVFRKEINCAVTTEYIVGGTGFQTPLRILLSRFGKRGSLALYYC